MRPPRTPLSHVYGCVRRNVSHTPNGTACKCLRWQAAQAYRGPRERLRTRNVVRRPHARHSLRNTRFRTANFSAKVNVLGRNCKASRTALRIACEHIAIIRSAEQSTYGNTSSIVKTCLGMPLLNFSSSQRGLFPLFASP